jgi:hypothetical protein
MDNYEIVQCQHCKRPEYYGSMVWGSGKTYCRRCIYEIWKKDSNYTWEPGPKEFTFPYAEDGIDHRGV